MLCCIGPGASKVAYEPLGRKIVKADAEGEVILIANDERLVVLIVDCEPRIN
jgi:hypothetical protein